MYSLTHTEHQFIYRLIKGLCSFSTLRLFCSLVQMIVHLASQFLVVLYTYNWGSWMIPRDYSVGALSFLSFIFFSRMNKKENYNQHFRRTAQCNNVNVVLNSEKERPAREWQQTSEVNSRNYLAYSEHQNSIFSEKGQRSKQERLENKMKGRDEQGEK